MKVSLMVIFLFLLTVGRVYAPPTPTVTYLTNRGFTAEEIVKRIEMIKGVELSAIWEKESGSVVWSKRGKDGEYSPFQIMPNTGKKCYGRWKTNFLHSAMCSASIILDAMDKCRYNGIHVNYQVWNKYNTGKCLKKATKYAQDVQLIIMKRML